MRLKRALSRRQVVKGKYNEKPPRLILISPGRRPRWRKEKRCEQLNNSPSKRRMMPRMIRKRPKGIMAIMDGLRRHEPFSRSCRQIKAFPASVR